MFLNRRPRHPKSTPPARPRFRPGVQLLEDRSAPAVITVNTFADVVDPDDALTSLREAIALAAVADHPGEDKIVLPHTIGGAAGTYALSLGELPIADATGRLTITSVGSPATIDARKQSRVFNVGGGSEVTFQGLTITGGAVEPVVAELTGGGGVFNLGTLTLIDCTLSGNSGDFGGGILTTETLTVVGSSVSGNSARIGGGVYNIGRLTITECTLSANTGEGVVSGATGDRVTQLLGNTITDNSKNGVSIAFGPNNLVGSPLAGNTITRNGGAGVIVTGNAAGAAIRGNLIYGNAGPGIDLGDNGPTANDTGDIDAGPSNRQNAPILVLATSAASGTTVSGTLNSAANARFLIDFYATAPAGGPPGVIYLGNALVRTDGGGNADFEAVLPKPVAAGWGVTATATTTGTAPFGDTSEFALGIPVTSPTSPAPPPAPPPPAPVVAPPPAYSGALVVGNILVLSGSGVPGGVQFVPVPLGSTALFVDLTGDGAGDVVVLTPTLAVVLDGRSGRCLAMGVDDNGDGARDLWIFSPDGTATRIDGRTGLTRAV